MIYKFITTGSGGAALGLTLINDWSLPFVGVPLTVIAMAVIGSLVSFAYAAKVEEKKKLYLYALASTFIATVGVAVFPPMLGLEWVTPGLQAPFAGLLAFSGRFAIPVVIDMLPQIFHKIFRLDNRNPSNGNDK